MNPAHWSAIAAMFSALSALLIMRIQKRSLLDAARPELVVEDWDREDATRYSDRELLRFRTLRNVGRGTAFDINIGGGVYKDDPNDFSLRQKVHTPGIHWQDLHILTANESLEFKTRAILFWDLIKGERREKYYYFRITIRCRDSLKLCHLIEYEFRVTPYDDLHLEEDVVPGIFLISRVHTTTHPLWQNIHDLFQTRAKLWSRLRSRFTQRSRK